MLYSHPAGSLLFLISLLESLNTARCIDQFLFARIERMAMGANGNREIIGGGDRLDHMTAGADNLDFMNFGMNLLFQGDFLRSLFEAVLLAWKENGMQGER